MPIPLIWCRHKDDHTLTHEIAETALPHFPDWEPIPADDSQPSGEPPSDQVASDRAAAGRAEQREPAAAPGQAAPTDIRRPTRKPPASGDTSSDTSDKGE